MAIVAASLRAIPYFADMDASELTRVAKVLVERAFAKGEIILLEGEACPGLYVVASGRVRIFKTSAEGKEQILRIMGPGESFNEVPVFDGGPNPASVEAMAPTIVYFLSKSEALKLVIESRAFAMGVIQVFASRIRHLAGLVEDLSFRSVTSRVAKILLTHSGEKGPPQRLTQQQMAAMAGTVREMVGRALRSLEDQGAIRVEPGRIVVRNKALLERLAAIN